MLNCIAANARCSMRNYITANGALGARLLSAKNVNFLMSKLRSRLLEHMCKAIHGTLWNQNNKILLWTPSFLGILAISMVIEVMQVAIRYKKAIDKDIAQLTNRRANVRGSAYLEISSMEEKLNGLLMIFRRKYGMLEDGDKYPKVDFNPIRDLNDREALDGPGQRLAESVEKIVATYRKQPPFCDITL